jgi:NADH-quinone oxidoreductase subunit L
VVQAISYFVVGLSWVARSADNFVLNAGFDESCETVTAGGKLLGKLQNGRTQSYLRVLGIVFAALVVLLLWSGMG